MNKKTNPREPAARQQASSPLAEVLEGQLEKLIDCLRLPDGEKSRIYEEVIDLTEQAMFKIALRRSNNVKTTASLFLGINRNTLQKKLHKFGLDGSER